MPRYLDHIGYNQYAAAIVFRLRNYMSATYDVYTDELVHGKLRPAWQKDALKRAQKSNA